MRAGNYGSVGLLCNLCQKLHSSPFCSAQFVRSLSWQSLRIVVPHPDWTRVAVLKSLLPCRFSFRIFFFFFGRTFCSLPIFPPLASEVLLLELLPRNPEAAKSQKPDRPTIRPIDGADRPLRPILPTSIPSGGKKPPNRTPLCGRDRLDLSCRRDQLVDSRTPKHRKTGFPIRLLVVVVQRPACSLSPPTTLLRVGRRSLRPSISAPRGPPASSAHAALADSGYVETLRCALVLFLILSLVVCCPLMRLHHHKCPILISLSPSPLFLVFETV